MHTTVANSSGARLLGALWLVAIELVPAFAAEEEKLKAQPTALVREVQQQLKRGRAEERSAALKRLADEPSLAAAKLALERGLRDKDQAVRAVALDVLGQLSDQDGVGTYLLGVALGNQAARRTLPDDVDGRLLLLAASVDDLAIARKAAESLRRDPDRTLSLFAAVRQVAAVGDEPSIRRLVRVALSPIAQEHFGLRRTIVRALGSVREAAAAEGMIELLAVEDGELRLDLVRQLAAVTGQQLGFDAAAWQAWWGEHGEDFVPDRTTPLPPLERIGTPAGSLYYGLPFYARRMVFVIDTSGSMKGEKLAAAQRELIATIGQMTDRTEFAVVAFSTDVQPWRKKLERATDAAKRDAARFVRGLQAHGETYSHTALATSFDFDTEVIYFLTDGQPTDHPAPIILDSVAKWNATRSISIYSIGIAAGPAGGPFDLFLHLLSADHFGAYRRVDR